VARPANGTQQPRHPRLTVSSAAPTKPRGTKPSFPIARNTTARGQNKGAPKVHATTEPAVDTWYAAAKWVIELRAERDS
jgi:hypothetical protein